MTRNRRDPGQDPLLDCGWAFAGHPPPAGADGDTDAAGGTCLISLAADDMQAAPASLVRERETE